MYKPHLLIYSLVACATGLPGAVLAQGWSFEQTLRVAQRSHPAVLGRLSSSVAAKAEQEGAEWQRFPSLSVEAGLQNNNGSSSVVRLQQPLWTGGRISAGIEAAGQRLNAADAAVAEARLEIGQKVIAAFTEVLRQQARQNAAVAGVKEHEKLLNMISRRVDREVSPPVDRSFANSRLFQAVNDLSAVTQARANALAQLSQLSGEPVNEVAGDLDVINSKGIAASFALAAESAVDYSPTLRRLDFEGLAAEEDIASKRSAYLPQLALRLEHTTNSAYSQLDNNRAMLVLEAQPGAGFSAASGIAAAKAKRDAVRQAREAALRDIRERVAMDWNELVAAQLRLGYAQQTRGMAAEVFDSYARQYTAGRKSWIDVLNAVREATQSEYSVADANAQAAAAALRLRLLTGNLSSDELKK